MNLKALGLGLSLLSAGPALGYNGVSVRNDSGHSIGIFVNRPWAPGEFLWNNINAVGPQAGDINSPNLGDAFQMRFYDYTTGQTIGYVTANTCAYNGSTYPCTYNVSGASYATNYTAHLSFTNTSALITPMIVWMDGTPILTNNLTPGVPFTLDVTNSAPFSLLTWVAGDWHGAVPANQVTGPSPLPPTNALWTGAAPADVVPNLTQNPPVVGPVATNAAQAERQGFNALLVQGSQAALQNATLQQAGNNLLAQIASNTASAGKDYSGVLSQIASNTLAGAATAASGANTLNTNLNVLRSEVEALTNRVGVASGLGSDTNGVLTALETGNSGFNSAMSGKLGSIPTWGHAAPSYLLPFSQLGVEGLEDAHFDFGQTGFENVVPVVRGFLLFLVTVAGVFAGYRILRNFEPS